MRKTIQTAAEHVAQLQAIAADYADPYPFTAGQLARRKPITLSLPDRDGHHLAIGAVLEVIANMRTFTGDCTDTAGPAILLAAIDPSGGYHRALCESWQYEPVTPDQIATLTGRTSH